MTYSDNELRAYLTGVAPDEMLRRIDGDLANNALLQQRLTALDPLASVVRDTMQRVPDVDRLNALLPPETGKGRGRMALLASVACALIAVPVLWNGLRAPTSDWRVEAARYQALYVTETLQPLVPTEKSLRESFARASVALGQTLEPGAFEGIDGLELKRAQVLGFEGAPLIQIAFTTASGAPVALCLMGGDDGSRGASERSGLASASWGTGALQFMLIGPLPARDINAYAAQIQLQFDAA